MEETIKLIDANDLKYQLLREFNIDVMENSAACVGIYSDEDARGVVSMALQARKIEKGLEEYRQKILRHHIDYMRAVNDLVKHSKEKLFQIQENLRLKAEKWMIEQSDNPFTKIDEICVEDGKMYKSEDWDFEIIHAHLLPSDYMMPDEEAIEDAIKNGIRQIAGVKIFKIEKTQLRIKN